MWRRVPPRRALLGSDHLEGLTATGTGRRLFGGYDGKATETTLEFVLDNDGGLSALASPANLKGLSTIGAGRRCFTGDEGGAAGTVEMENSPDVALHDF